MNGLCYGIFPEHGKQIADYMFQTVTALKILKTHIIMINDASISQF